jgi:hypothetical protein
MSSFDWSELPYPGIAAQAWNDQCEEKIQRKTKNESNSQSTNQYTVQTPKTK